MVETCLLENMGGDTELIDILCRTTEITRTIGQSSISCLKLHIDVLESRGTRIRETLQN